MKITMKHIDVKEFKYTPPVVDLANTFDVVERENSNGTFDTSYNLNIGCSVVGIDDIPSDYIKLYYIKRGDCWKSISYRLYNTIEFWWILAKINGVDDVLETLEPGSVVKYLDENIMGDIYSETKRISESNSDYDND